MFSLQQKRDIADAVQKILRDTKHPELPKGEIQFHLHVDGAESWSWADIKNNGFIKTPGINPWNEAVAFEMQHPTSETKVEYLGWCVSSKMGHMCRHEKNVDCVDWIATQAKAETKGE